MATDRNAKVTSSIDTDGTPLPVDVPGTPMDDPLPLEAFHEHLPWSWEGYPEYRKAISGWPTRPVTSFFACSVKVVASCS